MNTFNAAAILNTELTTLKGRFGHCEVGGNFAPMSGEYTWFCTKALALTLNAGDYVVVEAKGEFKIVCVTEVHEDAEIDLDATFSYSFAIQKIQGKKYWQLKDNINSLAKQLDNKRRETLRNQVAAQFGISSLKTLAQEDEE